MDDRGLFRYPPGYAYPPRETVFDWGGWPGGLAGAAEMCNNNGACRTLKGGVMCPSYRATRNERDLTRGRANTLRLALSGQLGRDAFASDEMAETMKLCISCKGCRNECPMSVDMAKMKLEVLAERAKIRGVSLRDRLVANLPRYAPMAARVAPLMNLRDRVPGAAWASEKLLGLAASRPLPWWRCLAGTGKRSAAGCAGLRGLLQPLFRAGEPARCGRRAGGCGAEGGLRTTTLGTAALLWQDLSGGRDGR
jgi:Fe-S oxidoreductase